MIVRPYEKGDENKFILQDAQNYMTDYLENAKENIEALSHQGYAWTVEHNDEILMVGGIIKMWEGRGQLWALVSKYAGAHMVGLHRVVLEHIAQYGFNRVEATVDVGFKEGVRWIKMLGFEFEGYMKAYRPDGSDMLLFARIA